MCKLFKFLAPTSKPNSKSPEDAGMSCVFSVIDIYETKTLYFLTGIYEASFIKSFLAKDFISNMKDDQLSEWQGKYGKSASESLREFALEYVGKPIDHMLRYYFFAYVLRFLQF